MPPRRTKLVAATDIEAKEGGGEVSLKDLIESNSLQPEFRKPGAASKKTAPSDSAAAAAAASAASSVEHHADPTASPPTASSPTSPPPPKKSNAAASSSAAPESGKKQEQKNKKAVLPVLTTGATPTTATTTPAAPQAEKQRSADTRKENPMTPKAAAERVRQQQQHQKHRAAPAVFSPTGASDINDGDDDDDDDDNMSDNKKKQQQEDSEKQKTPGTEPITPNEGPTLAPPPPFPEPHPLPIPPADDDEDSADDAFSHSSRRNRLEASATPVASAIGETSTTNAADDAAHRQHYQQTIVSPSKPLQQPSDRNNNGDDDDDFDEYNMRQQKKRTAGGNNNNNNNNNARRDSNNNKPVGQLVSIPAVVSPSSSHDAVMNSSAVLPHQDESSSSAAHAAAHSHDGFQQQQQQQPPPSSSSVSDTTILGALVPLHGTMSTCCNGLFVVGPQTRILVTTTILILVPFLMVAGGVMPHLAPGLIFMDIFLFFLTMIFLFRTAFIDPGYVEKRQAAFDPRLEHPVVVYWSEEGDQRVDVAFGADESAVPSSPARQLAALRGENNDGDNDGGATTTTTAAAAAVTGEVTTTGDAEEEDNKKSSGFCGGASSCYGIVVPAETAGEVVHKFPMKVRYCRTCCRYKAPRTFHCDVCQACVDGYDHHCPFTGTCVGQGNYASFLGFMFSLVFFILFMFISIVAGPVDLASGENICINDALDKMGWMPVVVLIFIYMLAWGPIGLLILHVWLVMRGQTTMEHLREKFIEKPNPFDRGSCWRNVLRALGVADPATKTETYDVLIVDFERGRRRMYGE